MSKRNPGIDVLRGISIFLVLTHHLALRIPLKKTLLAAVAPSWLISGLSWSGNEAVFIFFVISGFLITSNAFVRWGGLDSIRLDDFYLRRASRILPCLLGLVAVLSFLDLAGASDFVIDRPGQSLLGAVVSALGLHLNWYEGVNGYLPGNWDVLWSLSIEEVFYLGFPIVCLLLRRERLLFVAFILFALSLPIFRANVSGSEIWKEKAYLPGMAAISAGIFGAIVAARVRGASRDRLLPRFLGRLMEGFGWAGVAVVLCFNSWIWHLIKSSALLLLTVSTTLLLIRFYLGPARSFRGLGWLQSCGRLSYEIYLTHMFVVWPIVDLFRFSGGDFKWGFLWYVPEILCSWGLGWLVARFFSVPVERWIRGLRLAATAPGPVVSVPVETAQSGV